jgi:hypothetical protein
MALYNKHLPACTVQSNPISIGINVFQSKFHIRQMWNRFTTRNQWFTETIKTIRTSGLTLIISTIRFFKTFTAEFGIKFNSLSRQIWESQSCNRTKSFIPFLCSLDINGINVVKSGQFFCLKWGFYFMVGFMELVGEVP